MSGYINNLDQTIFIFINVKMANPILDPIMLFATALGTGGVKAAIGLAMVYFGFLKYNTKLRRAGYAALAAHATSAILVQIIKKIFERERPLYLVNEARTIKEILYTNSFPSGHTTSAFAFAFALGYFYPKFRIPMYFLAIIVGFSRVYLGVHFPSDVVFGALIGGYCGFVFGSKMSKTDNKPQNITQNDVQPEPLEVSSK
ncbi:MAG: phosphatase PAP2 family protein [Armatimonadota bacterium]